MFFSTELLSSRQTALRNFYVPANPAQLKNSLGGTGAHHGADTSTSPTRADRRHSRRFPRPRDGGARVATSRDVVELLSVRGGASLAEAALDADSDAGA